jgi:hypothetical protein
MARSTMGEPTMTTIQVRVVSKTEDGLRHLMGQDCEDISAVASRLLARAVRAARPRPNFDTNTIREANASYADEDVMLAESATAERASLLSEEDTL